MQPSPWLYSFLKNYEKFRPTAYAATRDERRRGIWTIGWGHTRGVKEGDTATTDQAETWLQQDVAEAVATVNDYVEAPLTQAQFDALCSLAFNIGGANFASSSLVRYLNERNYTAASAEFPKWDHQGGVVLEGLLERRNAERAHFDGQ
jgi:lysozyme